MKLRPCLTPDTGPLSMSEAKRKNIPEGPQEKSGTDSSRAPSVPDPKHGRPAVGVAQQPTPPFALELIDLDQHADSQAAAPLRRDD
jgi:hypothetical protein